MVMILMVMVMVVMMMMTIGGTTAHPPRPGQGNGCGEDFSSSHPTILLELATMLLNVCLSSDTTLPAQVTV